MTLLGILLVVFIKPYYRNDRLNTIDVISETIEDLLLKNNLSQKDLEQAARTVIGNNVCAIIYNENGKSVYYQVMEYAENGELKDYITGTTSRIPEKISAKIFIQIANAVKYLHENNIAHCDIKPENILMDKDFIPKINDFGFSQKLDRNEDYLLHKRSGTPRYSSPDVLHAYTKGYDGRKNDIFSLGVLLFVITIGDFPFNSATYSDDKYKFIIKKKYDRFWEYFNYIEISDEFKDLINKLICSNPAKRLSIDEILQHPWLMKQLGINYDEIYNNIIKNDFMSDIFFDKEVIKEMDARKFLK